MCANFFLYKKILNDARGIETYFFLVSQIVPTCGKTMAGAEIKRRTAHSRGNRHARQQDGAILP